MRFSNNLVSQSDRKGGPEGLGLPFQDPNKGVVTHVDAEALHTVGNHVVSGASVCYNETE
jgi:hypothetical protein